MLTLNLNTSAWRDHLRSVVRATPGIVPVAKGNGYGFGLTRLAEEAELLGVSTIAVGLPGEVAAVRQSFTGSIVVLAPWRPGDDLATSLAADPRVITTVSRVDDLARLGDLVDRPRVLCEAVTSMHRHGIATADLGRVGEVVDRVRLEGWTIHLPIGTGAAEGVRLARACRAVQPVPVWLSHFPAAAVDQLPTTDVRLRVGTQLWLGDPASRSTTATVLDVHRVKRGEPVGYRQRKMPYDGWVVVVAGGTSHAVGLEAPTAAVTGRQRLVSLAIGGLAATGRALSPYTIDGKKRWFVEPPHMQSSLVLLPSGATPPAIGDQVPVELRLTTAVVDRIVDAAD